MWQNRGMRRIARLLPGLLVVSLVIAPLTASANDKNKPQSPGQAKQEESKNLSNNGNNGVVKPVEPTAAATAEPAPAATTAAADQPKNSSEQTPAGQSQGKADPASQGQGKSEPAQSQGPQSNAQEPAKSDNQPKPESTPATTKPEPQKQETAKQPEPTPTQTAAGAVSQQPSQPKAVMPLPSAAKTTGKTTTKTPATASSTRTTKTAAATKSAASAKTSAATTDAVAFDPDLACGSKTIGDANERSVRGAEERATRAAQAKAAKKPLAPLAETAQTYIVRLKRGANVSAEATAAESLGTVKARFTSALPGFVASLTPSQLCDLEKRGAVETIEDDLAVSMMDTQPNATWGLDRIDQANLPLSGTYSYTSAGAGVRVYVVDTGIRSDHTELSGRVQSGYTAIADGNGTTDCNGHGTHVSGTIAGTTWGVAKQATVVPVRVLGCDGSGTSSGVIAGLDWIAANAAAPAIVNMSLGGGANSTLDAAVNNLIAKGFTVVVAAGNSAVDACTSSPARVGAAVTVAASDSADRSAAFTNFGTCVDLYGPGVGITSASISSTTATAVYSGTSMAAPHVAGVAALVLAANPGASPAVVSGSLLQGATGGVILGAPAGTANRLLFTTTTAVQIPQATVPFAPENLAATSARRSVTLTWTKPNDGGAPLTEYRVTMMQGSTTRVYIVSAANTSTLIRNLKTGRIYSFMVSAVNSVGVSAPSSSVTITVR